MSECRNQCGRDTATNPAVLSAFALAIAAGSGPPAFPGIPGHEPDVTAARRQALEIGKAWDELLKVAKNPGCYVSESDFFEGSWQQSFWGSNYRRLAAVKKKHDPAGLFFVHHGVGSEAWSADGFTRLRGVYSPDGGIEHSLLQVILACGEARGGKHSRSAL